jgi:hypothetical protein
MPAPLEHAENCPPIGTGGFSLALYLKHREYNSAIGAALLYLCLLFLRPALAMLPHGSR